MLMGGDMLSWVMRVLKDVTGDVKYRATYHPSSLTVTVDDVLFWYIADCTV